MQNGIRTYLRMKPSEKKLPKGEQDRLKVTKFMCDNFFDIRSFGAVMTTGVNCGQVRGPIQMCFAESVDPDGDEHYPYGCH